ncbi:hypothetical protein KSS87_011927 [Heliosperma pusillum]|nr:hypothetical protein KSS87_011927 [Heliosperma pusillum]
MWSSSIVGLGDVVVDLGAFEDVVTDVEVFGDVVGGGGRVGRYAEQLKLPMSGKKTLVYRGGGPLVYHLWDNWEDHRVHLTGRSEPATFPGETKQEYERWFEDVSHLFIIDPDHLDAPLPRDDVVVNVEFSVARRMEDDAEQLKFFRRMMKDVGPLIDHRLSRRKPRKCPTPGNRLQRESDGRYDNSDKF